MKNVDLLAYWITERESIRRKKEAGLPRPWTTDPILHAHHFCNVHRQDDRTTKELQELGKGLAVVDLPWFYTMARLFNYAPTVKMALKYSRMTGKWGWTEREQLADELDKSSNKTFHTAYLVSTCGARMEKVGYVLNLTEMVSSKLIPYTCCQSAYEALREIRGLGSFMAGQIIADLKNDRYLSDAPDKFSFAVMGPGSKKGLDYIYGGRTNHGNFLDRLTGVGVVLEQMGIGGIDNQDLQSCLCEFSKFMRYKNQERGRVRYYDAT